jgi:hypothetical protein
MTRIVAASEAAKQTSLKVILAIDAPKSNFSAKSITHGSKHGGQNASRKNAGAEIKVLHAIAGEHVEIASIIKKLPLVPIANSGTQHFKKGRSSKL